MIKNDFVLDGKAQKRKDIRNQLIRDYFTEQYQKGMRTDVIIEQICEQYFISSVTARRILTPMKQLCEV